MNRLKNEVVLKPYQIPSYMNRLLMSLKESRSDDKR